MLSPIQWSGGELALQFDTTHDVPYDFNTGITFRNNDSMHTRRPLKLHSTRDVIIVKSYSNDVAQ